MGMSVNMFYFLCVPNDSTLVLVPVLLIEIMLYILVNLCFPVMHTVGVFFLFNWVLLLCSGVHWYYVKYWCYLILAAQCVSVYPPFSFHADVSPASQFAALLLFVYNAIRQFSSIYSWSDFKDRTLSNLFSRGIKLIWGEFHFLPEAGVSWRAGVFKATET